MKRSRKADPRLALLALVALGAAALFGDRIPVLGDLARYVSEQVGLGGGGAEVAGLDGPLQVVRVKDGDTLVLSVGGRDEDVRLIGIDTPEKFDSDKLYRDDADSPLRADEIQALGESASRFAESLLAGEAVYLEPGLEPRDRYGRLLAYLYLPDPGGDWTFGDEMFVQANLELVRAGWADALTVPPNDVYEGDFENAADAARRAGAGMWGEGWVSLR